MLGSHSPTSSLKGTHIKSLPTLSHVIEQAKAIETANHDISSLEQFTQQREDYSVYGAKSSTYKKTYKINNNSTNKPKYREDVCTGCGKPGHNDYEARKANCPAWGRNCNNCGLRNHFSSVCKRRGNKVMENDKEDKALGLIALTQCQNNLKNSDMLYVKVTPIISGKPYLENTHLLVLPDSGANICLAGHLHMNQMRLTMSDLKPVKRNITTAGGFKIQTFGYIDVLISINNLETLQSVYFVHRVQRFYLSKIACIKPRTTNINQDCIIRGSESQ